MELDTGIQVWGCRAVGGTDRVADGVVDGQCKGGTAGTRIECRPVEIYDPTLDHGVCRHGERHGSIHLYALSYVPERGNGGVRMGFHPGEVVLHLATECEGVNSVACSLVSVYVLAG